MFHQNSLLDQWESSSTLSYPLSMKKEGADLISNALAKYIFNIDGPFLRSPIIILLNTKQ